MNLLRASANRLSACGRALRPWLGRTLLPAVVLDPSGQASPAERQPTGNTKRNAGAFPLDATRRSRRIGLRISGEIEKTAPADENGRPFAAASVGLRYFSLRSGCCRLRRLLRFLSRDFLGFPDFLSGNPHRSIAPRSKRLCL